MANNQTMEQIRAHDAYQKVQTIKGSDAQSKYLTCVQGLPATIIMNGLGQACATLLSSGEAAQRSVYNHLKDWLCANSTATAANTAPYAGEADLMTAIINNDQNSYLRAQVEALAWLQWLKKFATAYLA